MRIIKLNNKLYKHNNNNNIIMDIVLGNVQHDKPILAFYMGYSVSFNGKNYHERDAFGSEITIIHLAEALASKYKIYVFGNCTNEDEIVHNDVTYISMWRLNSFTNIDIMVLVRYMNYFLYFNHTAKKTFIMVTDSIINPSFKGDLLPNHGQHIIHNVRNSIDGIVCLSDWHKDNLNIIYKIPDVTYHIIPNPILTHLYKPDVPIIPGRFIYMQDPSRGFELLLDCLLYIQKTCPEISLVAFRKKEFTKAMNDKLSRLKNVTLLDKESQETISKYCLEAEYFFYPSNVVETFCCCAAEAQLYKTVCIYNAMGGLLTTIGDRGLALPYDFKDPAYVVQASQSIINLMKNDIKKQDFINRGHKWAKKLKPNIVKKKWIKLFS